MSACHQVRRFGLRDSDDVGAERERADSVLEDVMFIAGNGCPLCAEAKKIFVTDEMKQRKERRVDLYSTLGQLTFLVPVLAVISGTVAASYKFYGLMWPSLYGVLMSGIALWITINRFRRWNKMYPVRTGYLLTECATGAPHIHLSLPDKRDSDNLFSVYRAEISVDPVWVGLKLEADGEGTGIDSRLEQLRLDTAWEIRLQPAGLNFSLKAGKDELWWSGYRPLELPLQAMLRWIGRWSSVRSYLCSVAQSGNPIEYPWLTQGNLTEWMQHILGYVKDQSPKPLNGATMRSLLEAALDERHGTTVFSSPPEYQAEVATKVNAIIGIGEAAATAT